MKLPTREEIAMWRERLTDPRAEMNERQSLQRVIDAAEALIDLNDRTFGTGDIADRLGRMVERTAGEIIENDNLEAAMADLAERELSITIYPVADGYAVWAFASDDPELGVFPGGGATVAKAIRAAIETWDGEQKPSEPPEPN